MTAQIIDGKSIAESLRREIAGEVGKSEKKPGLAVVLVGENPASQVYVASKAKQTIECGMNSFEFKLPENTPENCLLMLIHELNEREDVDGILVQLPLPDHINGKRVIEAISPTKDVDGFTPINAGKLFLGLDSFIPCTPQGSMILIKSIMADLAGKNALVIGRSNIVGKPMSILLLQENCTVTIAHSKTSNLRELCKQADIIVAAIGKPEFVKGEWLKEGAVVIDVGINRMEIEGKPKLKGDVHFESASARAGFITPVPGGVGPMTIACLLQNTLKAFKLHCSTK